MTMTLEDLTEIREPMEYQADEDLIKKIIERGSYAGRGSQRAVFYSRDKKWVYKIALNDRGLGDNDYEARSFREKHKFIGDYAKCRFVGKSSILIMEALSPMTIKEMPDWADFIDCAQVGRNRRGQPVAYDYGWY